MAMSKQARYDNNEKMKKGGGDNLSTPRYTKQQAKNLAKYGGSNGDYRNIGLPPGRVIKKKRNKMKNKGGKK